MLHITDQMVSDAVGIPEVQATLLDAFRSFGTGEAVMQERSRSSIGDIKLSTLGAVIPSQGVLGAKVYSTIGNQFSFVIVLLSSSDGRPLASLEANAITRLRTAACSVIAARHLARPTARRLALFGTGVQAQAHALQMSMAFPLEEIVICPFDDPPGIEERIAATCGVEVRFAPAEEAVASADIVVTASRATQPLFAGAWLKPGAFVAGVGSSLPSSRELDDATLERASVIAVEWRQQSLREAGDLVLADPAVAPATKIVELGELVTGRACGRRHDDEITLYKAVGVGLEDIAIAGLAYRLISGN